jgi:hypothetical protein
MDNSQDMLSRFFGQIAFYVIGGDKRMGVNLEKYFLPTS